MRKPERFGFLLFLLLVALAPAVFADKPSTATAAKPADPAAAAEARAQAYYHFTRGRLLEELAQLNRRSDYFREAIDAYKEALKHDPASPEPAIALADAYRRSGRIREAVLEAQEVLGKNPDDLAAHRLLGRIYVQTLGELEQQDAGQRTLLLAIEEYEAIARLDPRDAESLLLLARLHRINNDLEKAEAALKKLLAAQPRSEDGLTALALLYSDKGESEQAIALLKEATQGAPSAETLASLAYAYEQAGDWPNAVSTYRLAQERDARNPEIRRRLAEALLKGEYFDQALAEYRALAEADPVDPQPHVRLSQIHRRQKRFAEAEAELNKARELAPDNLEIAFQASLLEEAQGNFGKAIAVLTEMQRRMTRRDGVYAPEQQRLRGVVLERLGGLYRQTENFEAALAVFAEMRELGEPGARAAAAQAIQTHRQARQLDAAVEAARAAAAEFPEEPGFTLELASLLGDRGELEPAEQLARGLLANNAEDLRVHLTLAQIYERNKRYPQAEAAVAEAQKLADTEDERERATFLLGAIYERQKKYDPAEEQFRKALELNPRSAITLNYLGYMLADRGVKLEESVALVEKALEEDPYNGAYLDSLGWAYFRQEKLDLAEDYLRKAVARISRDPTIHDHLGDLYFKTRRYELAQKAWEQSVAEWQRAPKTEFDPEAFARVEEKLNQVRALLAPARSQ